MGENAGHNYVPYASWDHLVWQVLASVVCNKGCAIILTFVDEIAKLFKAAKSDVIVRAEREREIIGNDKNGAHRFFKTSIDLKYPDLCVESYAEGIG